jgi:hypothetical protein
MQDIYTYVPEINHVCREHNVAIILQLVFVVAYNAICSVKSVVLLHQYFPKCVCSAQYVCFFVIFDFVFFRYVAHVFSELF